MKYLLFFFLPLFAHDFAGKHFIASYKDCDPEAINNYIKLEKVMYSAVSATNAYILDYSVHYFDNNGLTVVYMLSESHASIHTYPEHNACFVDLFTCGDKCTHVFFDCILRKYLSPKEVICEVKIRE